MRVALARRRQKVHHGLVRLTRVAQVGPNSMGRRGPFRQLGLGGLDWAWTWVVLVLYFTCIHSTLVLFGMYGLIKAMSGQVWRFPLIGPPLE